MTFVNKKTRVFRDRGDLKPVRRRSESRLKTYPSAVDVRAWCDQVEDRRQHILELIETETEKCLGKFVPLDAIINALMADKNTNIKELKKCLGQLWKFVGGCSLGNEDKRKLVELKKQMSKICLDAAKYLGSDADFKTGGADAKLRMLGVEAASKEEFLQAQPDTRQTQSSTRQGGSVTREPDSLTRQTDSVTRQTQSKTSQPKPDPDRISSTSSECPAKERHLREQAEVDSLTRDVPPTGRVPSGQSSYSVKAQGPIRMTSKVKGIKPGSQFPVGSITVKAQRKKGNSKDGLAELKEAQPEEDELSISKKNANGRPKRMSGSQEVAEGEKSASIEKADIERIVDYESIVLGQKYVNGEKPDGPKVTDGGRITKGGSISKGGSIAEGGRNVDDEGIPSSEEDRQAMADGKKALEGEKSSDGERYTDEEKGGDMPDELQKLQDQLAARDALCEEQQNSIENLRNERDNLNKRIQDCLLELEGLKKLNNVSDPGVPTSCKEEIEALEQEMLVMRSGNLSPEQEAEVIKKEVEVLKKYCLKLKAIEEENELLKSKRSIPSGDDEVTADGPDRMEQLEKEKAELVQKVKVLEQELQQNRDVPENFEIYKNRSDMLDNALAQRDDLQKKLDKMRQMELQLEEMKEKADRADELERTLKYYNKNDRNTDYELKRTQSKCICLEKEQQNLRSERDSMSKRIDLMNNELESLRSKAKEAEMMKLERDRLQIKLNELSHVQVHNENLMLKCKCLENAAMERDAYKLKYEEILGMECQCEMMKLQIEESRNMARERDALVKQVMDLESCIKDQEEEIKRLVAQIDNLMKNKDETQSRMRDALSNMRAEVEKKDQLIAASEEKLAAVQAQLKSSIQGVSCETLCYKMRIEELERELCGARCRIGKLERQLTEKEEILRGAKRTNKSEYESVGIMKRELEAAKAENNKLQEIAKKMVTLTGDEHVQKMLRQSECAVRRVVEELGKQYREWDHMRSRRQKQRTLPQECSCKNPNCEDGSDFESADEKLKEELRDIQREKEKLENIVRQIQEADGPQKQLVTMRLENEKLQEQLQEETNRRRALEQKLNKILS